MPRPKLEPGTNTIDTSAVVDIGGGTLRLQWRLCRWDGKVEAHTTKMQTRSKSDIRRRAHRMCDELLAESNAGRWKASSQMSDYIRSESIAAIERNEFSRELRPNTQARYKRYLTLLADELKGYSIADAAKARTLLDALRRIATRNGTVTAKKTATTASKYVMRRLVTDGIISYNPLRDLDLELPQVKAVKKPEGGQALSASDHARVVDYLLELDPTMERGRGRWSAEQRTAKRKLTIDLTLVQATTGMRISEVRNLMRADIDIAAEPMLLTVREGVSKTHIGRTVPVLDARVAERVRERVQNAPSGAQSPVFGAPCAPREIWDRDNAQKATKALYGELAEALDIPLLTEVGTHVWRSTLNTMWMERGVPVELRAAYLGHSKDMNRASYTDTSHTEQLISMLKNE